MKKLIFVVPLFLAGLHGSSSAQKTPSSRTLRGITEPYNSATISATVAGRVAVIRKKEGEYVRKGEVILELEKEEEELEVALRKLILDSKVEVMSARYKDSILNLDYLSTKQLFDSTKSVSEEELIKKELDYKLAVADHERLQIQEKREQIEYEIARAQLNKRSIVAPFNGFVVKIFLKIAESCNPQEPLVRIADVGKCRFISHIESSTLFDLKTGAKVRLAVGAGSVAVKREGEVEFVSPVVDPSSGLREVKVIFDNEDNKVKPGVVGSMSIVEKQ
ncbi:MAG: efflux RND transporter periplasmic adaptor subunit [Chitinispirillaceae bacterium]|nr:efflux RND transporter periplasmic adaptor subunit [Chitinispirillaceae bacterium]